MRKWMPMLLIAIAYLTSALVFSRLPAMVAPEWGRLFPFIGESGSEPASRTFLALVLPTSALATFVLFRALRSRPGARISRLLFRRWAPDSVLDSAAIERFEKTYDLVAALIVAFIVLTHITLIGVVLGWGDWLPRVFTALVGLGIAAAGNVMPRVRPNAIMGVRTRKTLNDPLLWARTHRLFGALFMVVGVMTIVLAIAALEYALIAGFAGILVACLTMVVYLSTTEAGSVTH